MITLGAISATAELNERLNLIVDKEDWNDFINTIKPKMFNQHDHSEKMPRSIVAKISDYLTRARLNLPDSVKIVILKCLTNSCIPPSGYQHHHIDVKRLQNDHDGWNLLYANLSRHSEVADDNSRIKILQDLPETVFPYDGIAFWILDYLWQHHESPGNDQLKVMRSCYTFMCNLVFSNNNNLPRSIFHDRLKLVTIKLLTLNDDRSEVISLLQAVHCFIGNVINIRNDYLNQENLLSVVQGLLRADRLKIDIANDTIMVLIKLPNTLQYVYEFLEMSDKLYLIEIIYHNVKQSISENSEENTPNDVLTVDAIEFIADRFKKRSDLILKTADTYLIDMEPTEVIILLDLLCVLTSTLHHSSEKLKSDKSLLINAVFLLKALHSTGKVGSNNFTPIQKLKDLAPSMLGQVGETIPEKDIQNHVGFGFKAALIRFIGNLVYQNKLNQDEIRELDGIPLLLDCCNIDARNPLIMQWAIFAIRNLCEGNLQNQLIIEKSQKIQQ